MTATSTPLARTATPPGRCPGGVVPVLQPGERQVHVPEHGSRRWVLSASLPHECLVMQDDASIPVSRRRNVGSNQRAKLHHQISFFPSPSVLRTLESFLWPSDSRITSYIHNAVFYDDQECAPCRCHLQACRGSWEGFRPCLGHLPRGPLLQERDHGCAIDPFGQLCQAGRAGRGHRQGRLRLGARRRDGRSLRPEHHDWTAGRGRAPPGHRQAPGLPSDDCRAGAAHSGLCQGRCGHHFHPRRAELDDPPAQVRVPDQGPRLQGWCCAQPGHAPVPDRARA
mmetsp:Transcript_1563/g.5148  ORF Transcript_1563/g.5148 Transcript_1563/m.5148 type:complete len:282 (+) Transcript_1563:2063-2908(+)